MKKAIISLLALLFIFSGMAVADQKAITEDGKSVLLKDDGTWEYSVEKKDTSGHQFRNASWGMSRAEVRKSEKKKPADENENMIAYSGDIAGLSTFWGYIFAGDKLTRAKYLIQEKHTNKNDYIHDFENLKALLTKKYGAPAKDDIMWKNNLYKNNTEDWGFAIGLGHLVYAAQWETDDTTILLLLHGENYNISTWIEYTSKELSSLEKQVREEKSMDDL